ncbi:MAG TPA: prolipoprotein diacylglyceryl transferase [Mycobacterium sp.]|nr:prolipoprotein diacylglyceryl transferase [Mycobacterium sp.]
MTTTFLASFPSPSQGVWHLGPLPIRAYALFIVAGMLAALWIGEKRWVERGGEEGAVYSVFWWAMPFGLLGGRLYHVITDWRTYFGDDGAGLLAAFRIWEGGLGIWGAVALGGVGAWIGCRRLGIPLPAFGDAVAPGIVLAQAIGRLGNYFNQELYGRATTLPWGLDIYERRDASGFIDSLNGISTGQRIETVHPTFLYELLWNLLVFAVLIYIDRRFKIGHGRLFATYVAGYCLGRFWIELMRSDAATHIAGIRINSFTATFVFIGAVVYIMVAPKGREDPATLKGKPPEVEGEVKAAEEEEETSIEDFVKELTGVAAATSGVVAAAKVAGEAEGEDAKAAADEGEDEAEELVEDVAEAPAEDIAEGEEFAEAKAEAESVGGVGVVQGEEAVEAEAATPEAHETAVEAAEEVEGVAAEVADAAADDELAEQAEVVAAEVADAAADDALAEEAESVGGMGAVQGEEAVEAEAAAPAAHEAAVEAAEEAEGVAAEVADAAADDGQQPEFEEAIEPADEAEAVEAEAAVEETEGEPSEEEAAEVAEAVVDEAEAIGDDEPEAQVLADESEPEAIEEPTDAEAEEVDGTEADEAEPAEAMEAEPAEIEAQPAEEVAAGQAEPAEPTTPEPQPAEDSGGRLRRWLRGRRSR